MDDMYKYESVEEDTVSPDVDENGDIVAAVAGDGAIDVTDNAKEGVAEEQHEVDEEGDSGDGDGEDEEADGDEDVQRAADPENAIAVVSNEQAEEYGADIALPIPE